MVSRGVISVFIGLLPLISYAQVEIRGNVTKMQGDLLQDHPVYLYDEDGFLDKTATDDTGRYFFELNSEKDLLYIKTVGFCGFWDTYTDSVNLGKHTIFEIDFRICHNLAPIACDSKFTVRPESEYIFSFTPISQTNEFSTYEWHFGDGETSSDSKPEHRFDEQGVYNVSLIMQNPLGCIDTATKEVLVGPQSYVRGCIETNDNYLSNAFIWLIGFDSHQNSIVNTIVPDAQGKFHFWCESQTKYLLKLVPDFSISNYSPRLLPTYLGNAYYWQDAEVLNIGHEIKELVLVTLESDFIPHGFNEIHGYIHQEDDSIKLPMTVYLLDETQEPIDFARVKEGKFDFENLPSGSYFVLPESPGKVSYPYRVNFDGDFDPDVTTEFKVGTTQINPLVGLEDVTYNENELTLSPMPVKDVLHIRSKYSLHNIRIYDINGSLLKEICLHGRKNADIETSDIDKGTYLVRYVADNEISGGAVFLK